MKRRRTWRSVLHDRTAVTLLLAGLLVLPAGWLLRRSEDAKGLPDQIYWQNKIHWAGQADVVLAGDSRIYRGLSPAEMNKTLPDLRVLNYGFDSMGYSQEYLQAVRNVLDDSASRRVIVMGITPHSLTAGAERDNGWLAARRRYAGKGPVTGAWPYVKAFFEPSSFEDAFHALWPSAKKTRYYLDYQPDGWVSCVKVPETPERALRQYVKVFNGNAVQQETIQRLCRQVRQWTDEGIVVYGFRPPTALEMVRLENQLSGFDEVALVKAFQQAGGVWLETNQSAYHSYDASHLRQDAALALSTDLAAAIARHQTNAQLAGSDPDKRKD